MALEPEHLVLDTDAGGDDAVAIMALLKAEEIRMPALTTTRVIAITCARGNTTLNNVVANVMSTLELAGRLDIPVYSGAAQGLLGSPAFDGYYGEDGFGDFRREQDQYNVVCKAHPGTQPQPEHAAVALGRLAAERPGKITLVCMGPLTNIALAVHIDPNFLSNLKNVYIMGGAARGGGNTKANTEFNVHMDPEAAEIVFRNLNKPAFLLPWETVLSLKVSEAWRRDVLGAVETPAIRVLNLAERKSFGKRSDGLWAPADPLLACAVLDGELLAQRTTTHIAVVLGEGPARAATLVDFANKNGLPRNVVLLEQPNTERFKRLLLSLFEN